MGVALSSWRSQTLGGFKGLSSNRVAPPGWQRLLRSVTAALLGLGLAGGMASAAFYWPRSAPTQAQFDAAADQLVPEAEIGQIEVRSVNDAVDAGPNERRAQLDPEVSLAAVMERATQSNFAVEGDSSDQIRVDVGAVIARVRPGHLDVTRDDRLIVACLIGLSGVLGAGLAATKSWRLSRSTAQARGGRARLLGAAFLFPLGLLFSAVWLLTLLAPVRLTDPLELAGVVLSVIILLAGFWVPLGAIVTFFVWLATHAGRTRRTSNDPGR